ncbi:response regulator [Paenibacillus sp. FSL W8-0186]|uniref:DNA-binding response regulator n=1 Tax=Paenibacillus woosongensis TaxID=307580 RepID=A0ABQ4MXP7_9BACL|nr:response regulator [Paenibacillus woosongensis]GIP60692.1 DNA-binding response regulator [Paenibacillus woosongensis]
MYKVLLADDEMLDLEGMKRFIPWSELGLEVVDAVSNGFAACDVIKHRPVDILVTDINMPNMSGLELARKAIEKKPDIRIVFVSGYQDFHYVKQALSMKACSYVLKPVDDDELIASLQTIKQELELEGKRKEAEKHYQRMIPMAKNELLIRLLEGELQGDESEALTKLAAANGLFALQGPLRAAVIETDELNWKQLSMPDEAAHSDHLLQKINKLLQECGMEHACKLSKRRLAVIMQGDRVNESFTALYDAVNSKLAVSVTIGLGEPVQEISLLPQSYRQALEALDGKMFIGRGHLIKYDEVRRTTEMRDAKTLDIRLDALFKAMSNYELVKIHDEIDNLFQSVSTLRSKFTIYNLAMYIVFKLEHYLSTLDEDLSKMLGFELSSLDIVLKFEMMDDIRSWLVRKAFEISETLRQRESSQCSRLIRDILSTMQEQMHENMTLKDIAHKFSFSPNYLGHLFKEEVGKTFSEMLVQLRMEKACELLRNPTLKIYEVADQVGYRYIPYFSRQFKETYGMTPMEFRKRE